VEEQIKKLQQQLETNERRLKEKSVLLDKRREAVEKLEEDKVK